MKDRYCIVVAGPTAVGKTAGAQKIALDIDGEIINGDMGQWYVPLTIGTAKPDWRNAPIAHHLFDIIATPITYNVMKFRADVRTVAGDIWQRNKVPIIVGGSSYYSAALFFPPAAHTLPIKKHQYDPRKDWWASLHAIDPQRAQEIDPHDTYRIQRALDIWQSTGIKPSSYKPHYDPIAPIVLLWLERDRNDLYARINERVIAMVNQGWIEEVQALLDTPWEPFLLRKKIIGYPDVIAYCRGEITREVMIARIQQKTRNYAKRQMTFWRMLSAKIKKQQAMKSSDAKIPPVKVIEVNLTHEPIDRYIKHLVP